MHSQVVVELVRRLGRPTIATVPGEKGRDRTRIHRDHLSSEEDSSTGIFAFEVLGSCRDAGNALSVVVVSIVGGSSIVHGGLLFLLALGTKTTALGFSSALSYYLAFGHDGEKM